MLLTLTLLLCAFSASFPLLLLSSLAIGLTATVAQDIIPAAATLASEASRGKTVGAVMTGLLAGILLSRVFSGALAEYAGWRSVYALAALGVLPITLAIWRMLPRLRPHNALSYPALLRSLGHLWAAYPELRRATLAQGFLSLGFSAFWSTLALMLAEARSAARRPARLAWRGRRGAGGRWRSLADRHGPDAVTRIGAGLVLAAFALMFLLPLLPLPAQLALIALSAVGFDLGIQATLIAHQTIVYGLDPAARSQRTPSCSPAYSSAWRAAPSSAAAFWQARAGRASWRWRRLRGRGAVDPQRAQNARERPLPAQAVDFARVERSFSHVINKIL